MGRRLSDEERGPLLARVSLGLVGLTALCLVLAWLTVLRDGSVGPTAPGFVVAAIFALGALVLGHLAILHSTGEPGERILFETFFPAGMSLVPVAGPFIALWSAVGLLRGRLGAATISSDSSSTSYEATDIGRSGVPVGLLLVMLAANQPLAVWAIQRTVHAPPDEATARAARLSAYGEAGCAGLVDCYSQAGFVGQAAGRAVLQIGEDGAVTAVELTMPDAPEPVVACVRGLLGGRRLPGFADPPGTLTCAWAGSVSGQARAVNLHADYRPHVENE